MSSFFPHVKIPALKKFAIDTAASEHPSRSVPHYGGTVRTTVRASPRIVGCEDFAWAGEKMIVIAFDPQSLPFGPHIMLAHFPQGRPKLTTQALVGMMTTVRSRPVCFSVPKIYAYKDTLPNEIGAEVVLLEKIPGESLDKVWRNADSELEKKICFRLAEILLNMFNYRGSLICTDLLGTGVNTQPPITQIDPNAPPPPDPNPSGQLPVLLSPPFDHGPLKNMAPQAAVGSASDYLAALAHRTERVFSSPNSAVDLAARDTGHPENPLLSDTDVERARETWSRLASLIPYHIGGFYLPGTLSSAARHAAYELLQSKHYGIYHSDMHMARFLVQIIAPPTGTVASTSTAKVDTDVRLVLATGWERAYRAPLWSCARFPPWLIPRIVPDESVKWGRQQELRWFILQLMHTPYMMGLQSQQWICAHLYGHTERWFEGCLSSHWMFRDTIEVLLVRLKTYWEHHRPDVPFPLDVGTAYRPPGKRAPGESVEGHATLFAESINALAKASGTSVEQWDLAG